MNIYQTPEAFRSNPVKVARLAELLNDPILAEALLITKDRSPVVDVALNAPDNSSVRELSRQAGRSAYFADLIELSEPLIEAPDLGQPTWGVPEPPPVNQE